MSWDVSKKKTSLPRKHRWRLEKSADHVEQALGSAFSKSAGMIGPRREAARSVGLGLGAAVLLVQSTCSAADGHGQFSNQRPAPTFDTPCQEGWREGYIRWIDYWLRRRIDRMKASSWLPADSAESQLRSGGDSPTASRVRHGVAPPLAPMQWRQ